MSLSYVLETSQMCFFALGLAPSPNPFQRPNVTNLQRCMYFIPAVVVISVTCGLAWETLIYDSMYSLSKDRTYSITGSLLLSLTFLLFAMSSVRAHTTQNKLQQMNDLFVHVELDMQQNLFLSFDVWRFVKRYTFEVMWVFVVTTLGFVLKFLLRRPDVSLTVEFTYIVIRSYKYIVIIHSLFYIDLVVELFQCLKEISSSLDLSETDVAAKIGDIWRLLVYCKKVHYKLFQLTRFINDIFGWSFAILFAHSTIDFMFVSYWVYYYIRLGNAVLALSTY